MAWKPLKSNAARAGAHRQIGGDRPDRHRAAGAGSGQHTGVVPVGKDAAAFGPQLAGFTIPQALNAIYDHGAGTVVVINVLDPALHKSPVAGEAVTLDAATGQARPPRRRCRTWW